MVKTLAMLFCAIFGWLLFGIAETHMRLEWNASITRVVNLKPGYQVRLLTQKPLSKLSENWATDFALGRMLEVNNQELNFCAGTLKAHAEISSQDQQLVQNLAQTYDWLLVATKIVALVGATVYLAQLFKLYEETGRIMAVLETLILSTILFAVPLGILALVVGPTLLGDYFCITTGSPETDVGEVFLKFNFSGLNWESMTWPISGLLLTAIAGGLLFLSFWQWRKHHAFIKQDAK